MLVPPAEYDPPVTYAPLTEVVPVASVGTIQSWTWQSEPLEGQPLDKPFAWALIKLDGADTTMLHAVAADSSEQISTGGARVHAHWIDEPVGAITDIAYFELGDTEESVPAGGDDREPVTILVSPSSIEIQHTASLPETTFLRGLEDGKLLGAYRGERQGLLPAQGSRSRDRAGARQLCRAPRQGHRHHVRDHQHPVRRSAHQAAVCRGVCVARRRDIPFLHLIQEIDVADVRMGMRVQAVWKPPREEWGPGHRQHRVLQTDRRTRRRLRHLQAPPLKGIAT